MPVEGRIDYETRGDGRGVLVLHGGRLDRHHMIDALEPVFADSQGHRRIYPDLPGHGRSPADGVETYDDCLDRLEAFAQAVLPPGPALLIGESRGGYFARALAHRMAGRVAGLALVVPAREPTPPADRLADPEVRIPAPSLRDRVPSALRARFDRLAVQSEDIVRRISEYKLPALARTDHAWQDRLEANHGFADDPDAPGVTFEVPVLILLGRQDAVVGWRDMLGRIDAYPHATVAVLDCAGHNLAWERPQLFAAHLRDWLERTERAP